MGEDGYSQKNVNNFTMKRTCIKSSFYAHLKKKLFSLQGGGAMKVLTKRRLGIGQQHDAISGSSRVHSASDLNSKILCSEWRNAERKRMIIETDRLYFVSPKLQG